MWEPPHTKRVAWGTSMCVCRELGWGICLPVLRWRHRDSLPKHRPIKLTLLLLFLSQNIGNLVVVARFQSPQCIFRDGTVKNTQPMYCPHNITAYSTHHTALFMPTYHPPPWTFKFMITRPNGCDIRYRVSRNEIYL